MARTRFVPDSGLTVRMTTVMFLLGALFVGLIVALMYAFPSYAVIIGLMGIGIAFFQWWNSDRAALRAMRARVVTPEEAPELHGMIDRLCAMADMPKPRVAIADTPLPNAFATGRSPSHSAVCVTTGILQTLTAEELEAGYAWLYERLFSLDSIWARRPHDAAAVPPYLAMAILDKRMNPVWQRLIQHRLTHAVWKPLVEATRQRHLRFRERLAREEGVRSQLPTFLRPSV